MPPGKDTGVVFHLNKNPTLIMRKILEVLASDHSKLKYSISYAYRRINDLMRFFYTLFYATVHCYTIGLLITVNDLLLLSIYAHAFLHN